MGNELDGAATGTSVTVGSWTGPLPNENKATRAHRIRQGLWRESHLKWPAGMPQNDQRVRDRYPTLPNWLADSHNGQSVTDAGLNIMSDAARRYTRERLRILETIDGKAEGDRLWRNLLSSQPMAFSIAGHLRAHRDAAAQLMAKLTDLPVAGLARLQGGSESLAAYALDGIEAEWFPPRSEHTGDMSGCDIASCLTLTDARRVLVTIEVKYTDTFSAKPVSWDRYSPHLIDLGLDPERTDALVRSGCSQVLRQVMITNSVRRRGLTERTGPEGRVDESLAVVLAREDDATARRVAEQLDQAVGQVVPVRFWSHRRLLDKAVEIEELSGWSQDMIARYAASETPASGLRKHGPDAAK